MGTAGCPVLWGLSRHFKLICRDHEVLSLGQESLCFLVLTRVGLSQRGQLTSAPECGLRTQECCFWRGSQGPSPLRSCLAGSPQSGYPAPLHSPRTGYEVIS